MITYETPSQTIIKQERPVLVNGVPTKVVFVLNSPGGLKDHDAKPEEHFLVGPITWRCDPDWNKEGTIKDAGTW